MLKVVKNQESIKPIMSSSSIGWNRLKKVSFEKVPFDKFFVRNTEDSLVYEDQVFNENLLEQVKNLKKIIEYSECSDKNFDLLELTCDFLRDINGKWYFLNVVDYKKEFLVNKKVNNTLPRMKRTLRKKSTFVSFEVDKKSFESQPVSLNQTLSRKELLAEEVLKDLESPKNLEKKVKNLYFKAYHLKPKYV